ncbi:hypothetical protein G3N95_24100 [Paraburkholderia sp. Tr-20389]|uniref:hypothetical protein n=1 Tax=Paraburkholderia sp. Tr-20389 TaxID=2703903 RepID=UPI00197DBB1D|nr:hypothetical protein [Paraburkholderia sp. Tr-20389]MBN3756046.1 hypothetical protein [Paraburkholderia sp. Tr-20389]
MDKHVRISFEIKASPAAGRDAWLAATRELRAHGVLDACRRHSIVDPGHTHGREWLYADSHVDPQREMMARNLMKVRRLPCDRE